MPLLECRTSNGRANWYELSRRRDAVEHTAAKHSAIGRDSNAGNACGTIFASNFAI